MIFFALLSSALLCFALLSIGSASPDLTIMAKVSE